MAAVDSLSSGDLASKLSASLPGSGFCAPVSIQVALALVAAGSTGETLSQLQSALGWPTTSTWQQDLAKLLEGLTTAVAAGEPLLVVANRVYTKEPVQPEYAQAVRACFGASIEQLLSASQINDFVSSETRGMITDLVTEPVVAASAVIAINALYFKGKWKARFEIKNTRVANFFTAPTTQSLCQMMQTPSGTKWQYFEDAGVQYILLPYRDAVGQGSPLAALVALPRGTVDNALPAVNWRLALRELSSRPASAGTLWLPRFEVESEFELSGALKALGARRAFEPTAEFPGVLANAKPLMIDQVIHKVKVSVDEEGTVAAAATAVVSSFGGFGGGAPPPFQMRCDRPFAFSIVAMQPTPLVVFAGTVTNPGLVGPSTASSSTAPLAQSAMQQAQSAWIGSWKGSPASGLFNPGVPTPTGGVQFPATAPSRLSVYGSPAAASLAGIGKAEELQAEIRRLQQQEQPTIVIDGRSCHKVSFAFLAVNLDGYSRGGHCDGCGKDISGHSSLWHATAKPGEAGGLDCCLSCALPYFA